MRLLKWTACGLSSRSKIPGPNNGYVRPRYVQEGTAMRCGTFQSGADAPDLEILVLANDRHRSKRTCRIEPQADRGDARARGTFDLHDASPDVRLRKHIR